MPSSTGWSASRSARGRTDRRSVPTPSTGPSRRETARTGRRRSTRRLAAVAAAAALAAVAGSTIAPEVRATLVDDFHFTASELADLERGRIVKHALDASAPGEVAVVGAARIGARPETFVERARNIEDL